jgi:hypothetical protein
MSVGDSRYDASYNYIWYNDNGPWSTRFTAWYIPGLLYRNQGDDVANAQKALRNLYESALPECSIVANESQRQHPNEREFNITMVRRL